MCNCWQLFSDASIIRQPPDFTSDMHTSSWFNDWICLKLSWISSHVPHFFHSSASHGSICCPTFDHVARDNPRSSFHLAADVCDNLNLFPTNVAGPCVTISVGLIMSRTCFCATSCFPTFMHHSSVKTNAPPRCKPQRDVNTSELIASNRCIACLEPSIYQHFNFDSSRCSGSSSSRCSGSVVQTHATFPTFANFRVFAPITKSTTNCRSEMHPLIHHF